MPCPRMSSRCSMTMNRQAFLDHRFLGCQQEPQDAGIWVFGAPFDGTVTFRPGTRFGPEAMRRESIGLETYSPYQDLDLEEDMKIADLGDLDLPFGNRDGCLDLIGQTVGDIVDRGRRPFMVGGEHLVSLPAVLAVHRAHPDLCLVHFDAHTDLRAEYLGEERSHSSVIRRIWDQLGDGRIWQFGIRSGTREEFSWASGGHTTMERFRADTVSDARKALEGRPVYVTVDLDVLDPSVFAGTGTPEAGGLSFHELLEGLLGLSGLQIVGADVVELAPHYDPSGVSTAVACKVMRELLLLMGRCV